MTTDMTAGRFSVAMLASALLVLQGCRGGNGDVPEKTVKAAGTLTYQGQPLEYHQVYFQSDGKRASTGVSDQTGKFTLGTNQKGDGAPIGTHQVFVVYAGPPTEGGDGTETRTPPPKVKIPSKYQRPETSGLILEIPAGGTSDLKIELQ